MKDSQAYWKLVAKEIGVKDVLPLTQWFPWYRYHWNPYWIHRIIIEAVAQMKEEGSLHGYKVVLEDARAAMDSLWDTYFHSNKRLTHHLTLVALKSALGYSLCYSDVGKLFDTWDVLLVDGAYREGTHYSHSVLEAAKRALPVITDNSAVWGGDVEARINKQEIWMAAVCGGMETCTPIGDGWPEAVDYKAPRDETHYYRDMVVQRQDGWVVIQNSRRTGHCFHEHPEGNGILVARNGHWILPGDGIPSYTHKLKAPWRWDRPKNHWGTERRFDWPVLWRLNRKKCWNRAVQIVDNWTIRVVDPGKAVVRWPIAWDALEPWHSLRAHQDKDGSQGFCWKHRGARYETTGKNVEFLGIGHAFVTTGYRKSEKWQVVRLKGEDMETRIWQ